MPHARWVRPGRLSRLAFVVLLAGQVALILGGVAAAYWRGSGTGSGAGSTATALPLTLGPGSPTATLYPGGSADVAVAVSNPNAAPIDIGDLALDPTQGSGGYAVDSDHSTCATSTLSFITQTHRGAGWVVPGRTGSVDGTLAITLPDALQMDLGAANVCQGGLFTVYLKAGS